MQTPAKNVPAGQQLNKKDDAAFKTVMKQYESKQYKKALKGVEGILKTNPNHGESLAMKGLIMSNPPYNKKEEAYDLVKSGLMKNMKSLICWHVYGLLYRGDHNYLEAIKCYKQALKIEDNNLAILRDLSMLQVHMRDLQNLTDTRQRLLELKPSSKANWLAFAFAHHLQGNHECALAILDSYEGTMGLPESKYDASEFLLYRCQIKYESGAHQETLDMFAGYGDKLVDREFVNITSADCYEKLGKWDKAQECYSNLLDINSENTEFVEPFVETATKHLGKDVSSVYKELAERFPRSKTIQKMRADASEGAEFTTLMTVIVRQYIKKGIPSLDNAMKSIYAHPEKAAALTKILDSIHEEVSTKETLGGEPADKLTLFHVLAGLVGHNMRLGELEKALEYCEKAIAHTPTVDSIYTLKARVLKRMEKKDDAAAAMNVAREMDPADRCYNAKTAAYMFRMDDWEQAEKTFNIFTYKPLHETWVTACEMQAMWYLTEFGDCLYRLGDIENALRKYLVIEKTFIDIIEDQFDFHHYVTKKANIRAYLDLLRFMDTARNHKFYCRAATKIVRCYLDINRLGEEEVKKRVDKNYETKEAARVKLLSKDLKEKESEFALTIDYKNPLKAALPFLEELLKYRATTLPAQLLAIEFYSTMDSPLKALKAIKQAVTIPGAYESQDLKARVKEYFDKDWECNAVLKEVIKGEKEGLLKNFK